MRLIQPVKAVSVDSCSALSEANHNLLSSIDDRNHEIHTNVVSLQKDRDHAKHLLIMDWLSSADFTAQQLDHIQRRQKDTGAWFLNSQEFTGWVHGSHQTLFCPGIPGAGKTMMAAITVDHLQNTFQTSGIGVAYLYCSYNSREPQTTSSLLAAILKQLAQENSSNAKPVYNLYDAHEQRKARPPDQKVFDALQAVISSYDNVYIVLDALDECSDADTDRSRLLNFCFALQQQPGLHLMATSRHIPDIVNRFTHASRLEIRADPLDVKRYVEGQIGRLPKCIQRDRDLQGRIATKLAEVADGM